MKLKRQISRELSQRELGLEASDEIFEEGLIEEAGNGQDLYGVLLGGRQVAKEAFGQLVLGLRLVAGELLRSDSLPDAAHLLKRVHR